MQPSAEKIRTAAQAGNIFLFGIPQGGILVSVLLEKLGFCFY